MRARRIVAGVAVVAAAMLGNQAVQADPGRSLDPGAASLAAQRTLETYAGFALNVVRDARGLARSVGAPARQTIPLPLGAATDSPEVMARAHLERFTALFAAIDPRRDLQLIPEAEGLGEDPRDVFARFQQLRGGVPVMGGELAVVMDRSGGLRSITGELLPAGERPPAPAVAADRATKTALDLVVREDGGRREALHASDPKLTYLDPALVGLPVTLGVRPGPVWWVEVDNDAEIRRSVLVDAATGLVTFHWNMIAHYQAVCDTKNKPSNDLGGPDCAPGQYVATTSGEAANAFDNTARAKGYFSAYVGLDLPALIGSNLGDGKKLRSTVRFCPNNEECAIGPAGGLLANAFWNGKGMFYGDGWTAGDDIVAHELAHGVTEKTSRLLYFYQSGAINEALSDIFGELADLTNGYNGSSPQMDWVIGEDAPLTEVPLRNMADPTLTLTPPQPDRMTSPFYDPDLFFLDNGGVHVNSGVGNKWAYLLGTGTDFNGQTITTIGLRKLSRITYRVERMLTSGADYQDLAAALKQGCADLVGTGSGSTAIKETTCIEVSDAIKAVEMDQQPSIAAAIAPEAGYCPPGLRGDYVLRDSFENLSTKRWTLGDQWLLISEYAKHGEKSVWGIEPDIATSSSLQLNDYIPIPHGVSSFLRFEHQYRLDGAPNGPYYDGARLEYRLPGGSWVFLPAANYVNGPTKRVTPEGGTAYSGWAGNSAGYTSSRADISFLKGKKAQFRWRVIGDKQIAFDGWTVDDVRFFTCGTDRPSSVGTATATSRKGAVNIAWTAPPYVPSGGITKYTVELVGRGTRTTKPTTLSTTFGDLKKGQKVTIKITAYSKAGKGTTVSRTGTAG
ncbi:MAG: M4 family metallopeptidase [Sporichthyaceae bacterium]